MHSLHLDLSVAFIKSKLPLQKKNSNYHIYTYVIIVLALEKIAWVQTVAFHLVVFVLGKLLNLSLSVSSSIKMGIIIMSIDLD